MVFFIIENVHVRTKKKKTTNKTRDSTMILYPPHDTLSIFDLFANYFNKNSHCCYLVFFFVVSKNKAKTHQEILKMFTSNKFIGMVVWLLWSDDMVQLIQIKCHKQQSFAIFLSLNQNRWYSF